jgi:hypothetical protein
MVDAGPSDAGIADADVADAATAMDAAAQDAQLPDAAQPDAAVVDAAVADAAVTDAAVADAAQLMPDAHGADASRPDAGPAGSSDGGCGCEVARRDERHGAGALLALAIGLAIATGWSRRSTRRRRDKSPGTAGSALSLD